ncbi:N-6 DNA methylase [Anaeromusa acidaminophila]|uniref:N-6 DNA methylase n=1 Tax=Anaeromusa acidaminophila TaxID=81464 RepID=UPI00037E778A|nr:N-6 DNA methylase [Anaeromusa acidaminophila]
MLADLFLFGSMPLFQHSYVDPSSPFTSMPAEMLAALAKSLPKTNTRRLSSRPVEAIPVFKAPLAPLRQLDHFFFSPFQSVEVKNQEEQWEANMAALELLKTLQGSQQKPTEEEKAILARYSGWGGLAEVFLRHYRPEKQIKWHPRRERLEKLVSAQELEILRSSVLTSFYTPVWLIRLLWQAVEQMGFSGGRVLDPSMGTGRFFGSMPEPLVRNSQLTGIEIDPVSLSIAQYLYPEAVTRQSGFETEKLPNEYFDLAITNLPFGDIRVFDAEYKKQNVYIHNHFAIKALDKVRPGGLGVFITSVGTMQSTEEGRTARKLLSSRADLLGAMRLPQGTFNSAGTSTAADILFFRKRKENDAPVDDSWTETVFTGFKPAFMKAPLSISSYYDKNPSNQIGIMALDGQYGNRLTLLPDSQKDIQAEAKRLIDLLPADGYWPNGKRKEKPKKVQKQLGSYQVVKGELVQVLGDGNTIPFEGSEDQKQRVLGQIKIRNAAKKLFYMQRQLSNDMELKPYQRQLTEVYEDFVGYFGFLSQRQNRRAFAVDPDAGMLLALEEPGPSAAEPFQKAAIFTRRTIWPELVIDKTLSPIDALSVCLHEKGEVCLERIASLTQLTVAQIQTELGGRIYRNPATREWETAEQYLYGDVKTKLAVAQKAAEDEPAYSDNVKALEAVQPEDVSYDLIDARLGAPWIPESVIEDFIDYLLDERKVATVRYMSKCAEWKIEYAKSFSYSSAANVQVWGTSRKPASELMDYALNQRLVEVKDMVVDPLSGREKSVVNHRETLMARHMVEKLKDAFKTWIWEDDTRRSQLAELYNAKYNYMRLRSYDGSHMLFPGLNQSITLRSHQKDAIWRILQEPTVLLGHQVGAGKTLVMQAAGMELRRVGMAQKPCYCIPTFNFEDFVQKFRDAYPEARLLVLKAEDLPGLSGVKKFAETQQEYDQRCLENRALRYGKLYRIIAGDWDGVIISHELFRRLAVSEELEREFIMMQVHDLECCILEAEGSEERFDKRMLKSLEKRKMNLLARLEAQLDAEKRDIGIPFEELGIDALFVDESDLFKNLAFPTKMSRVAGVQNSGSERAMDLFMKVRWLCREGRKVVFATGTPISNTVAEMFTLKRYLYYEEMQKRGLACFDAWAATFGEVINSLERSPDGQSWRTVSRFANFINVPEMISMFRNFADIKMEKDLNLPKPTLETGSRIVVTINPSPELRQYVEKDIMERVEKIRNGSVKPEEDNMLKVTGDMRKASLDIRLVLPGAKVEGAECSKIDRLVEIVKENWELTAAEKGAQAIFCDISVPKPGAAKPTLTESANEEDTEQQDIVVYEDIYRKLVKAGIPQEEIVFVHSAKTAAKKQELFKKLNEGIYRVIIGSTGKMGAGANYQDRLYAEHHLDCPWRPRDIEQREGRILRQGNRFKEVRIYAYVTEQSADGWLWQTVKGKARFIAQALCGDLTQRTLADMEQTVLGFAEIEALATGNPMILEKFQVEGDIERLQALKSKWINDRFRMRDGLLDIPKHIESLERKIAGYQSDIANRIPTKGDTFSIELGGVVYTSRTDAQSVLNKWYEQNATKYLQKVLEESIGTFAGFEVRAGVRWFFEKADYYLEVVGSHRYPAGPSIASLERAIAHRPEERLEETKTKLKQARAKLAVYQNCSTDSFEQEEELERAKKRLAEIEAVLGINQTANQAS